MPTFDALRDESLKLAASSISTAEGLRVFLSGRAEVLEVRRALATGSLTCDQIRTFVQRLLRNFRVNRKFVDEYVLAAIAVALESFPGHFADQYLSDLASVRIKEMPLASRVASLAIRQRKELVPALTYKEFVAAVSRERTLTRPDLEGPREWKVTRLNAHTDQPKAFRYESAA